MKQSLQKFLQILISLALLGSPLAAAAHSPASDLEDALSHLRESRQSLREAKSKEANEAAAAGKGRGEAQRQATQQRREVARQRQEEKRKEVLLRLVDLQIEWMNRAKARVQRMPNLTAELKNQLASEVDGTVQKLNELKTRLQNASGQEAVKALAKEVRDFFKSKHEVVKKIVEAIHASRATNAVTKAEERAAAIKAKIQELKSQGKNTSELESELSEAEEKIDEAREAIGRKEFREANEDLKGAYQKFRGVVEKVKGL